ncbi:unnamed protein product [Strongylus vulgaris]|uniref:Uncharacterized protein n=1 Tax=Strongylus vulgaris TaxID=40348 RepID=A0A3P7IS59_STRVU|nr:unnamed protein product [Strongylus vulgaris]
MVHPGVRNKNDSAVDRRKTLFRLVNIIDLMAILPFIIRIMLFKIGVNSDQLRNLKVIAKMEHFGYKNTSNTTGNSNVEACAKQWLADVWENTQREYQKELINQKWHFQKENRGKATNLSSVFFTERMQFQCISLGAILFLNGHG